MIRRVQVLDDDGTPFKLGLDRRGDELVLTNLAHELTPGDARATPLVRAVPEAGGRERA